MTTAHDFSFQSIDGGVLPMAQFDGKAVLLVNVASQCGLTPQYAGLEALWRDRKDKGLVVLGVPANNFGAQEPGTEGEIKTFCETRFGIDFPMTAKADVIGATAHPLYKWLAGELGEDAAPKWNFHKYLINRDGTIAAVFGPRTTPDDPALSAEIDRALAR
ncbi:MAG: glutathione peroxidase [Rhizomicrobium sp.]